MKEKLIIITGASAGIGKATAQIFSEAGYHCLLLARRLQPMLDLELLNAMCKSVDVTDAKAVQQVINCIDREKYDIDCLVNNAGAVVGGHFSETDITAESALVDVNIKGIMNCTKMVVPLLQKNKRGTIINVSSIVDRIWGSDKVAVYCATKAAVKSFTQSLHMSYKNDNIRCCNVAPGDVESSIWDGQDAASFRGPSAVPLEAEQLAKMILRVYQQPQGVCIRDLVITHASCPV